MGVLQRLGEWLRKPRISRSGFSLLKRTSNPVASASSTESIEEAVPYDPHLLERVQSQWMFGDYERITQLTRDQIVGHPQRGLIAGTVAAAFQCHEGDSDNAQHWLAMALDWGCNRDRLLELMMAGVYANLADIRVMTGDNSAAHLMLQESLALSNPGVDSNHVTPRRVDGMQGGLRALSPTVESGTAASNFPVSVDLQSRFSIDSNSMGVTQQTDVGQTTSSDLQQVLKESLAEDLSQVVATLSGQIKKSQQQLKAEVSNMKSQIEAYIDLNAFMAGRQTLPALHGWPVSPDLAKILIQMVRRPDIVAVVEFGSGSSTYLMARAALERAAADGKPPIPVRAYDHLSEYAERTQELLCTLPSSEHVAVLHAPLQPFTSQDGRVWMYYDCTDDLKRFAEEIRATSDNSEGSVFVFVDGPPAATGVLARYPAIEFVMSEFNNARCIFLLDDYQRDDEKHVVVEWTAYLDANKRTYAEKKLGLEKGACILSVGRNSTDVEAEQ